MAYVNPVCGVYRFRCITTHKVYIGSSNNVVQRRGTHKSDLRHNRHCNRYLQYAWNKYGEETFKWKLLEKCTPETKEERENYWIAFYKSADPKYGYNLRETSWAAHDQKGSKNPTAVLTEEKVLEIKDLLIKGFICREIAKKYCVTRATINYIKLGKIWKHIGYSGYIQAKENRGQRSSLTQRKLERFHNLRKKGWSQQRIADKFGVSQNYISRALAGKIVIASPSQFES